MNAPFYEAYHSFICMCILCDTGAANITARELSALSNYLVDGASNGRADKCSISVYYNQNRKRRFVVFQEMASVKQCM